MATRADLKRKIKQPLDMEDELFVEDTELNDYVDEGLKECSAIIHNLYEDYFQTDEPLDLIASQTDYDLPEDIYARKVRKIFFKDDNNAYEVMPIDIERANYVSSTDSTFHYRFRNSADDGEQIRLYPAPQENDSTSMTVYYLRDVILPTSDSDTIDIPEFERFVIEYCRVKILQKEMDNPMLESAQADFARIRDLMIRTLQLSVPDSNNEIELGDDIYEDFYSNYNGGVREY